MSLVKLMAAFTLDAISCYLLRKRSCLSNVKRAGVDGSNSPAELYVGHTGLPL